MEYENEGQEGSGKFGSSDSDSGQRKFGGSSRGGYGGGSRGGRFGGNRGGGFRSEPREMHKITCSDCGQESEVPFKPADGRPVYCKDCYQKHKKPREF